MKFNYLCTVAIEVSRECLKDTGLNKVTFSEFLELCEKIANKTYGYLNIKDRESIKEITKYLEEVSKSHKINFDGCSIEINY